MIRVIEGEIFDVAVDARRGSPTFGRWVGVTLTGKGVLRGISIDPSLLVPADKEMLEDLILAAFADAKAKADATSAERMQDLTAGLPLPPGLKLPF